MVPLSARPCSSPAGTSTGSPCAAPRGPSKGGKPRPTGLTISPSSRWTGSSSKPGARKARSRPSGGSMSIVRASRIPLSASASRIAAPVLLGRCARGPRRREMQGAPRLLGPRAQRPSGTGAASLEAEADSGLRLALTIDILPPDGRDLALRAPGLLLLPVHRELGEIVSPVGLGLPPLDGPRGAAQGDPVLVPAGDEHGRADRGTIDKMLPRRQVFRAHGLVDGGRALGFIDGRGGRVHLREQVGRTGLARLADMHHVPGPLRVAFVAVPCLGIIGGFHPFRRGRQVTIGLEADAGDGRLACGGPLARGPLIVALPRLTEGGNHRQRP